MTIEEDFGFKRSFERKRYFTDIVFSHQNRVYSGTLKNVSLGGAFIATSSVNQFSTGDQITVSIPYTTGKRHAKRSGRVKWLNEEGFAIEFD